MKFHPAADIFPLLEGAEFVKLCSDIRANGLRLPIIQHPDGSILDGRNRFRACDEMGIRPTLVQWHGKAGTEVSYVLSLNLARRHLNESQRAMVAFKLATMKKGARTDLAPIGAKSQAQAAALLHVGERSVERAGVVLERGTKKQVQAVERGEAAVSRVANEIQGKVPKAKQADPRDEEIAGLKEWGQANADNAKELLAENETLQKIADSDDKLKTALAEIKKLKELNRIAEERIRGLMNEKNEAIKEAKRWRAKFEKAQA